MNNDKREINFAATEKGGLTMAELKPCPFCGGEAELFTYGDGKFLPKCSVCWGMIEEWFSSEEEAAEAWNRRADNAVD